MPAPKTLLAFAGAPSHPSPLDRAALLLIDAQREYVDGGVPLTGIEAAVQETASLLRLARANGIPVFHVVHHGRKGAALFDPDGPRAAIIPALEPAPGERVVTKALPNSFAGTDLLTLVKSTGRTELILAGFATHMCLSSTARAALDLGLRATVVASATATRDLPDPTGSGIVPAADVKRAALAALADRFAVVVPTVLDLTGPSAGAEMEPDPRRGMEAGEHGPAARLLSVASMVVHGISRIGGTVRRWFGRHPFEAFTDAMLRDCGIGCADVGCSYGSWRPATAPANLIGTRDSPRF